MELPTYTNIWKIEKRLYKLYDFRLPMPLPVGQMAAFLAIAAPYILILTVAGMPFSHTWVWLYVLPPGVLAWLVTRPVLEGKRLPELVLSQLRYLSEPATWCRMAPLAEKDEILLSATVWRRPAIGLRPRRGEASQVAESAELAAVRPATGHPSGQPVPVRPVAVQPVSGQPVAAQATAVQQAPAPPAAVERVAVRATAVAAPAAAASDNGSAPAAAAAPGAARQPAWPASPAIGRRVRAVAPAAVPGLGDRPAVAGPRQPDQQPPHSLPEQPDQRPAVPVRAQPLWPQLRAADPAGQDRPGPSPRPALTVRHDQAPAGPMNVVERALRTPRSEGWHERVVVVPGGHRPGKPDQVQRDQARARLPLAVPARIIVLGCTSGAGQTVITLLTGQLLASLRREPVAVLDLGAGPGSLTERAREIPRLLPPGRGGPPAAGTGQDRQPAHSRERGLQVVTPGDQAGGAEGTGPLIDAVVARYQFTLVDPSAGHVPQALHVADQLILVAPASADAAGSLAMTLEWLEANGHKTLATSAVTVLNGVSARTGQHVDKAAAVAAGQCRAIVRMPWDGALPGAGALAAPTVRAVTALAGVLVAGLADPAPGGAGDPAAGRAEAGSRNPASTQQAEL